MVVCILLGHIDVNHNDVDQKDDSEDGRKNGRKTDTFKGNKIAFKNYFITDGKGIFDVQGMVLPEDLVSGLTMGLNVKESHKKDVIKGTIHFNEDGRGLIQDVMRAFQERQAKDGVAVEGHKGVEIKGLNSGNVGTKVDDGNVCLDVKSQHIYVKV